MLRFDDRAVHLACMVDMSHEDLLEFSLVLFTNAWSVLVQRAQLLLPIQVECGFC